MMKDGYYEIDVLRMFRAIWHRIWIVILACVLCAGAAFAYARFAITPMYRAYALMYVNNSSFSLGSTSFSFNASELAAAQDLVKTYTIILKTRTTLNEVIQESGLKLSYEQLNGMVSASSENGTEIFRITVLDSDPYRAAEIANTIVKVLPAKVANIVEGSSVRTVDPAVVNTHRVAPNVSKYTITGLMIGALLACALIVFAELQDDQIHDEETLAAISNIPVLASVPDLRKSRSDAYDSYKNGYYYHYGYGTSSTDGGNKG